ncbi:MAG: T9SS type A sorting domain-containing protein, partial [Bacteroidetes bacterium]|nr:T9SS type A sorting domain-containing protein [Bacteroidota bacterium]
CRVYGVESYRCTFAHITAEYSANIAVAGSYFHHAFDYGGGGRAYGVVLQFATGECRIENNIFERLRHSMLLQAGANGNVFAFNYSTDPYWTGVNPLIPSDAAGDIVLHGNWPYANLFEHNICQNIVIDNSHGPNGPFNTFFRNRAEAYGIFFSADNSPSCNIVGNEITNTSLPYSLVNYSIRGEDHFLYGNNDKGRVRPDSNVTLSDTSYAYRQRPAFLHSFSGTGIGIPDDIGTGSIPARDRYENDDIFASICLDGAIAAIPQLPVQSSVTVYPNPARGHIYLRTEGDNRCNPYVIVDLNGRRVAEGYIGGPESFIDTAALPRGSYFLLLPELGMHRFVIE